MTSVDWHKRMVQVERALWYAQESNCKTKARDCYALRNYLDWIKKKMQVAVIQGR